MPRVEYAVLARQPVPGAVKTRLIPALGAEAACALHRDLREHTLALLGQARAAMVAVWYTPAIDSWLVERAASRGWCLCLQPAGDLGQRMAAAVVLGLSRADRVVLLGTDCPSLCLTDLEAVAAAPTGTAVLGPALDGGYYLLALDQNVPELFSDMPWGSAEVARITRERLGALAIPWIELPPRQDLDEPADLEALRGLDWRRL
jgi:uncharacterized protein